MSDDPFLSRWSRRKIAARKAPGEVLPQGAEPTAAPAEPVESAAPAAAQSVPRPSAPEPAPLPPIESLTGESDFAPFMGAGVDPDVRRQALKVLMRDPRFNVMDGLDVYIDDYTQPDPLPEGWLEKLNQVARLGLYTPPQEAPEAAEPAVEPGAAAPAAPPSEPTAEPAPPPAADEIPRSAT